MKTVMCDPDACEPLYRLVDGPFANIEALVAIERLVRAVVLHDEAKLVMKPLPYGGRGYKTISSGVMFKFFSWTPFTKWNISLAPPLIDLASRYGAGDADGGAKASRNTKAHIEFLEFVFAVVENGGSALLASDFGRDALAAAQKFPEDLFKDLDKEWQGYAKQAELDRLGLLVPPVLGIILTRCARRDAIPAVIEDLRVEWAGARKKVWVLLDDLRSCRTLDDAIEIRKQLSDASRLFTPERTELDTRPIRVFWEIVAAGAAGAGIAALSSGKPGIGALAGAMAQAAHNLPAFTHEFGSMLFGRGAFDLARRVRREVSKVELDALPRLLTQSERQKLGFR